MTVVWDHVTRTDVLRPCHETVQIRGRSSARAPGGPSAAPGAPLAYGADFHAAFFNDWLRFAGCSDVTEICWQPTALTAARDTDKTAALQRADAGSRF